MSGTAERCFFHVDLDAFFASVEQTEHPEYKGKPLIVSGNPRQRRNVVSTASYEARKFGVRSAMPAARALELCPEGIFVEPHMKTYVEYSKKVMSVLQNFSPDILQLSIDEACLDMTGTTRLFGTPVSAAQKIKETVKEQTGLSISIGIASNAYLAKICSDINKPDGLFQIPSGEEEQFISALPLEKLWGIGEKTLGKLHSYGFKTAADIKKHSENFLKGIFGESTASFLYNVSHGREPENFHSKPKSHSVSAEQTFEFDLTERDAIETSLLELCAEVSERLLEKNLTGFTVQLKIRYEDFSTVNIQSTSDTPVLCTDDLFEKTRALLDKKYDAARAIRLLGAGVQNVIHADKIVQRELFESGHEKKRKVEKAILDLEMKNPDIKILKARLLSKTNAVFFIAALFLFSAKNLNAQNAANPPVRAGQTTVQAENAGTLTDGFQFQPEKNPPGTSLFNYSTDSTNVEFIANGFWNLNLFQTTTATFGYGTDFYPSFSLPVFEQTVDLSIWFLLNRHWYLQGAFADKFSKNTIALGYYGDGPVKDVKISNRNIAFPDTYSLSDISRSIGGGDNQAPGISANFSNGKWSADAAVRYDMLSTFDKTYYGKNSVNTLKITKENFLTGSIFVLPGSQNTEHVLAVYVESPQGNFTDEARIRYKKISSDDFLILPAQNQIILSKDAAAGKSNGSLPRVLIEFDEDADTLLASDLGTFGTAQSGGSGYLGEIQTFFGSSLNSEKVPNVASYSYGGKTQNISIPDKTGTSTDGFFVALNSKKMLLAQNTAGFSPFASSFRYDAGVTHIQDVQVASESTETKSGTYSAVISDTTGTLSSDFFYAQRTYVDVYNPSYTLSSNNAAGTKITYASPEINFPFADVSPGTYLGFESTNDDCIMLKSFTAATRIDIGTQAVAGTVYVYKNGILDSSAKYNPATGEVTLSSGISDSDKIYITWCEESPDYQTGMISGAAGFKYDFLDTLSGDIALATRWSLNPNLHYAENDRAASSYATLSSKIDWHEEKISISNTAGATLQIDNITGNYRIAGFDGAQPATAYLSQNAGRNLPAGFTPLLNSRPNEPSSANDPPELTDENNCSVEKQSGTLDSGISGYKIPVSYNFSNAPDPIASGEALWASTSIALNSSPSLFKNASQFSFALKLSEDFVNFVNTGGNETRIYLQLGVSDDEDFTVENKGNIPTWKIFDSSSPLYFDVEHPVSCTAQEQDEWQTVSVTITDNDRAFFSENGGARIIITASEKPAAPAPYSGTIFFGPYEIVQNGILTSHSTEFSVSTEQVKQTNSDVSKFNKDTNYAQNVTWSIDSFSPPSVTDSKIIIYNYFDETDFSPYKNITLYFSYAVAGTPVDPSTVSGLIDDGVPLTLIFDRDAKSADTDGTKAVELQLGSENMKDFIELQDIFFSAPKKMHKLEIKQTTREVFIDGKKMTPRFLHINPAVIPTRMKLKVDAVVTPNGAAASELYPKGRFTLDELFLSDTSPKFILQDQLKANLKHDGEIVSVNGFTLLEDAAFNAVGNFAGTLHTDNSFSDTFSFSGNAAANVTVASVKISNEIGKSTESKHSITNAGHTIQTTKPILKFLSLEESFLTNKDDKSVSKENSAELNFKNFRIPVVLKGGVKIKSDSWSVTQDADSSLQFSLGKKTRYTFTASAKANQKKTPGTDGIEQIGTDNYFDAWLKSSEYQFSTGDPIASKRIVTGEITNTFDFPFARFSPRINFSERGTYTSGAQTLFSDTTLFTAAFPFKIANQNFSVSYAKSSSLVQNVQKGGSYQTDIETMCGAMAKRGWYFSAFPVYDLISGELSKKVLSTLPHSPSQGSLAAGTVAQSAHYNGSYNFSWTRPLFASQYDLFVPAIATFSLARDISSAENTADTYQLKGTVGYTSINIFSANGSFPVLKWCSSDEYNFSFQATLKIPRTEPENIRQLYSAYFQASFYKTQDDVLRTAMQFSFQDTANWSGKATVLFKRQTHFTPVLEIVKLFKKDFDYSALNISRTNSLNVTVSSSQSNSTNAKAREYQEIELYHAVEFQVLKQLSINASISGAFSHTKDEICALSCTLGIGGKLIF